MLTEIYISALLVDEELADKAWDAGAIDNAVAAQAWWLIRLAASGPNRLTHSKH